MPVVHDGEAAEAVRPARAAYLPNSVIERSRQILVAERPRSGRSANRAPAHPAPMAHLSRAQLEASKPSGKAAAAAAPKLYASLLVYCPPRPPTLPPSGDNSPHAMQVQQRRTHRRRGGTPVLVRARVPSRPAVVPRRAARAARRFPADAGVSAGRPRWMLVPEDAGAEMDCGAARCHIMDALEKRRRGMGNADASRSRMGHIRCEA